MKRPVIITAAAVGMLVFQGCGSLKVDSNTISLQKNGRITEAIVEDFSQDYYDEEELRSYIDSQVDAFSAEDGRGQVKTSGYKVEDGKVHLNVRYEDADTYGAFNGVEIFCGTVVQAQAEGYKFDTDFVTVEDGKANGTADTQTVLGDDELKALIVRENTDIIVPGTIQYVSAEGTQVTAKDTVTMEKKSDTSVAPLVYVIYI